MASRQQSYTSHQIGNPDEISEILARKFCNKEAASVLVVGLPRSGKRELAYALEEKLKKVFKIVLFDSEEDCAATLHGLLGKLDEVGINIDGERIKRKFDLAPAPSNDTKITIYKDALKNALDNFSLKNRDKKLLLVIRGVEKLGVVIEAEIFQAPPKNVAWALISSSPIKVVVSEQGGSSYAASHFDNRHTFYLKPFHGVSIESFCRLRKIEETQAWGDLMDFLSGLPAFARDNGQPSNFLEALRMHIVDRELIQPWIKDALDKYGCFELFDNDMGRKMLLSVRTPKESCDELAECAAATEWLKKQKEVGRFIIEYCDKEREFKLTDKKIQGHPPPHYRLKESHLEGRRINVVATLLQDYFRSIASGTREADWHCPPVGGRWNEVFNDHGEYARFNRVELETGGRTASEKGKDTSERRVKSKPDVGKWF